MRPHSRPPGFYEHVKAFGRNMHDLGFKEHEHREGPVPADYFEPMFRSRLAEGGVPNPYRCRATYSHDFFYPITNGDFPKLSKQLSSGEPDDELVDEAARKTVLAARYAMKKFAANTPGEDLLIMAVGLAKLEERSGILIHVVHYVMADPRRN